MGVNSLSNISSLLLNSRFRWFQNSTHRRGLYTKIENCLSILGRRGSDIGVSGRIRTYEPKRNGFTDRCSADWATEADGDPWGSRISSLLREKEMTEPIRRTARARWSTASVCIRITRRWHRKNGWSVIKDARIWFIKRNTKISEIKIISLKMMLYSILEPYMDIAIWIARKPDAIDQERTPTM